MRQKVFLNKISFIPMHNGREKRCKLVTSKKVQPLATVHPCDTGWGHGGSLLYSMS